MASSDELKEQQKQSWNKFSAGWKKWDDLVMGWLSETGRVIIEKAGVKEGDRVLDMATGTGEPGLTAAGMVGSGEVVGVDLAEEMLVVAAEKAAARGIANYKTQSFDGSKVPFEDNSFDATLSRFGVIFSPEPPALIAELVRVTKAGGKVSLSTWAPKEENPWATTAMAGVAAHVEMPTPPADAPGIFRYPDAAELQQVMKDAGLNDVKVQEVTGIFELESPELYWKYMSEIAAPIVMALSGADEQTRQAVAGTVVEKAQGFVEGGVLKFPWKSLVASGTV